MENYKDKKDLRGKPCDPDGVLTVTIYNRSKEKTREQRLKRRNLMNRTVIYTGTDEQRHIAKVIAFDEQTGNPVIYCKDDVQPAAEMNLLFIEA